MPPRIPVQLAAQCCRASIEQSNHSSIVGLFSALSIQTRSAHILASLSDNPGAYQKRIRLGRGPSSGKGKTSGRGHKGQKQHGKVRPWFQGGQTPLIVQRGKLGFDNFRAPIMSEVNLDKLQEWIDAGRIDVTKKITPKELIQSNIIGSIKDGIKLLGRGADSLKQPIDIVVSRASASAIEAVEKAGGKIMTRYYTKQSITRLVQGKSFHTDTPLPVGPEHVEPVLEAIRKKGFSFRLPDPTSRWDIEYYRDPAHRGYLSHMLKPGESPSLYFRVPPAKLSKQKKSQKGANKEDTKLWEKLYTARSRNSLFDDDDGPMTRSTSDTLFNDDEFGGSRSASPWDIPTPRKQQSRADLIRKLLDGVEVPDSYVEAYDKAAREDALMDDNHSHDQKITSSGITNTLAAAKLGADDQAQIMGIIAPSGKLDPIGRKEFNVLLALIGLAQEGESISLDGVDERRRNLPKPRFLWSPPPVNHVKPPVFPNTAELAAKPPQRPDSPPAQFNSQSRARKPSMDGPEDDPWSSSDLHRNHKHSDTLKTNGTNHTNVNTNGNGYGNPDAPDLHSRTTSNFTAGSTGSAGGPGSQSAGGSISSNPGGWGYYDGNNTGGFGEAPSNVPTSPFGGVGGGEGRDPGANPTIGHYRTISGGRSGSTVEENIVVTLMPEKEGVFLFQHHNYEVTSSRRGSKVIRRYSDFVWLLDCLHKRYPFRALPLLPPKRVAVNGNHLSNDGAFIEKRRRGLARFLNTLVRHPILGQEQLVIMFLTVPTELAVWRKQAAISVIDEFAGRPLPAGLEESLPSLLEELFDRTRQGVKRSAELYISTCNIMDRLVKRSEGVAADHGRLAMSLTSLTEASSDTYATDTNDVPLLNDGLVAMSKHLQTTQGLMEDESKAWDAGVLEDLKRQRDALVSIRDLFDRRERLDKDNIPHLERRIQSNETKLAGLRAKADGLVKPGEIEKVVEAIIKDKESIVNQHNRSIFVKECLRDELVYFQQTQFHVSRWNQDWAQERVKYSEMLADNWRRLLDELEGMPLGD
ncbi:uncharacterized protein GGS22DRAFT_182097 [Annulohypoxylon maeteangense]|uniref:uncharacterized protein n=1 Tax=Annulohypoxylon maeteangense TaxID=1927788 RepID=UPI002008A3B3|nr:uncharacterized protein GGS22DRAFT_182097 [Annulohypoxylon maeteangense]KAI0880794.1 hypothetical protein GGS22DRAFT_182097 [Annulohypoxylon maeteangense]